MQLHTRRNTRSFDFLMNYEDVTADTNHVRASSRHGKIFKGARNRNGRRQGQPTVSVSDCQDKDIVNIRLLETCILITEWK